MELAGKLGFCYAILPDFTAWRLLVCVCTCVHAVYVCVSKFCLLLLNYYLGQSLTVMNFTGYLFTKNKIMFP